MSCMFPAVETYNCDATDTINGDEYCLVNQEIDPYVKIVLTDCFTAAICYMCLQ